MSAFLLVFGLISNEKVPNFFFYSIRRALRLLPSISILLIVGYLMGDCWDQPFRDMDQSANITSRMASILLLINNYFDQSKYGSLTASLSWSCAADFQMSLVVFLIVTYFHRNYPSDKLLLARRLKYVFGILILLALVIRGMIFDKETRNMMKLVTVLNLLE